MRRRKNSIQIHEHALNREPFLLNPRARYYLQPVTVYVVIYNNVRAIFYLYRNLLFNFFAGGFVDPPALRLELPVEISDFRSIDSDFETSERKLAGEAG